MLTSAQIRQQFLDFFVRRHGHVLVPSSPVVPMDDPTLLFTNAGMNQFKPIFLGQEKRDYVRAVDTQKCIRAGGKHNDLDDVGRSRRHQTFFEMLGNWSFGDYFKRGAIEMAWELLTKVWTIDPSRLHVSCYEGNEPANIPRDDEAANLWKEISGLPDDHIHFFGKDNFWEMGDTGPCGPCSEIHIDRTPDKTGGKQVNGDDPRVMEIWNLVFIQYNRDASGKLTPLPARHVDTGMGFERICQVLQGKEDNYGTDLWTPLFERISQISTLKYTGQFTKTNSPDPVAEAANEQLRHDIAFRVVADHIRCLTFALTDGAVPSNEGRGYVLRRILRRAVRFGRQQLGLHEAFLHTLVPVVVDSMGEAFPELKRNPNHVIELIRDEELSFGRTLDRGILLFEDAVAEAVRDQYESAMNCGSVSLNRRSIVAEKKSGLTQYAGEWQLAIQPDPKNHDGRVIAFSTAVKELQNSNFSLGKISAKDAFTLHDTYGFPIDLTRIMAEERGMSVDIAGYEKLMEQARELARAGGKEKDSSLFDLPPAALAQLDENKVKPTDDRPKHSHASITATVMAIWNGDDLGLSPANAVEDEELAIILDRTNFYAEMGGQVGDSGELRGLLKPSVAAATEGLGEGLSSDSLSDALTPALCRRGGRGGQTPAVFDIESTRMIAGYVLHIGRLRSGSLHVGDSVTAAVAPHRLRTEKNHTATHLANWALRETLGDAVQQKGSLVDPEKLRFDFSHSKSMSDEEIGRIERLVEEGIQKDLPVYAEEAPQEKALKIHGLRAVFGEKYPPIVRVVSIGAPVADLLADPANPKWRQYSIEFCGGTHLAKSSQAGGFTIIAEESVSKGIRRIVALTDEPARRAKKDSAAMLERIEQAKSLDGTELGKAIAEINQQLAALVLPLGPKRKIQAGVGELQAKYKAWEKANKTPAGGAGVDTVAAAARLLENAAPIGGGKLIVGEIAGATDEQLRAAIDSLRKKSPSHAIMLASAIGEKVTFIAAVSDDEIVRGLKAGDWVKQTAAIAGGGGGGRPQMAQGSGKDPGKIADALAVARDAALRLA